MIAWQYNAPAPSTRLIGFFLILAALVVLAGGWQSQALPAGTVNATQARDSLPSFEQVTSEISAGPLVATCLVNEDGPGDAGQPVAPDFDAVIHTVEPSYGNCLSYVSSPWERDNFSKNHDRPEEPPPQP